MVNRDSFQPSKELRVVFGSHSELNPSAYLVLSSFLQNKFQSSAHSNTFLSFPRVLWRLVTAASVISTFSEEVVKWQSGWVGAPRSVLTALK